MIGECGKLRGAAVGLTRFNEGHGPEVALAVLTGESQAFGLAVRAFITVNPAVRRVGLASGVPVFQVRRFALTYGPIGQPKPANDKPVGEGTGELTFAYTPGLVVVGSSRAAVADVVARYKGEGKAALADAASFREAATPMRRTGLFFYASPRELCEQLDAAGKGAGEQVDADGYAFLKMLAKPKSLRYAAGCVRFRDKGLSLAADFALEPGAASLLLTLFGADPAAGVTFRPPAEGFTFCIAAALPAADRSAAVLGFLDDLAKAAGALGRAPAKRRKSFPRNTGWRSAERCSRGRGRRRC